MNSRIFLECFCINIFPVTISSLINHDCISKYKKLLHMQITGSLGQDFRKKLSDLDAYAVVTLERIVFLDVGQFVL